MAETKQEITLPVGASAEPDTCGSCKHFKRLLDSGPSYVMQGYCTIKLPPTVMKLYQLRSYVDGDEERMRLNDTERCDLQHPDGKAYIVQRRVPPLGQR